MITNNYNSLPPINPDNQNNNSFIDHLNIVINRLIATGILPRETTSDTNLDAVSDVSSTIHTRIPSPTYSAESESTDNEFDEDDDDYVFDENHDAYEASENQVDYEGNLEQYSNNSTITITDSEDSYTDSISERSYCGTPEGYQSWSGSESGYEYHHSYDNKS
jgi:hypothetical protein